MERWISFFGLFAMIGLAWLLSPHKRVMNWRVIIVGVLLQFAFGYLVLNTDRGYQFFDVLGEFCKQVLSYTDRGSELLFGLNPPSEPDFSLLLRSFAFGILPTIIFVSALMSILYHLGIMQLVVKSLAWVMQRTLGTSGAETLSTAANIFVGQTEAPLVIRPYVATMTTSELMTVMIGGFATIAGGVMAVYIKFGIDASHLLTASIIAAPATLVIAKVIQPEVEEPRTASETVEEVDQPAANVIEAAAEGTSAGLQLALNVGAMLIAFTAIIAMLNGGIGWLGEYLGTKAGVVGGWHWSLENMFGYCFAPIAWLMGIEWKDCFLSGQLLGTKWVATELVAYRELGQWVRPDSDVHLSHRTVTILTYALCGFANFASIGIQIGGIGAIAPSRRSDLAKLGLRAMIGGSLASFMTACVAGVLYSPSWEQRDSAMPPAAASAPADDATKAPAAETEDAAEDPADSEISIRNDVAEAFTPGRDPLAMGAEIGILDRSLAEWKRRPRYEVTA